MICETESTPSSYFYYAFFPLFPGFTHSAVPPFYMEWLPSSTILQHAPRGALGLGQTYTPLLSHMDLATTALRAD